MADFNAVAGHERIIKSLRESIKNDMTSHAYVFCGNKGSGRNLTASAFAKTANCLSPINGNACGKCPSCIQFESGNNPDVFYVKATKTISISVDDIREQIVNEVKIKPYSYKRKIFIIDKADTMTSQAQNALLKTLEEPPKYVLIILIAENTENFLPTVLSRCVMMKFSPISVNLIKNYLINNCAMNEDDAAFYAEYSVGSIGEALRLSGDENFYQMRNDIISCLDRLDTMDFVSAMLMAKEMEKYKAYSELFDIMYMFYRDVFCMRLFKDDRYVIQKDKIGLIEKKAKNLNEQTIAKRLDFIMDIKKKIRQNTAFRLSMEVLFMNLKES